MKPLTALLLTIVALYRPALFEDTPLYPDPIVRTSNSELPCELVRRHADGTVDVRFKDDAGKWHMRLRQPVIVGPTWDGAESGVVLTGLHDLW